ncbi:MAG: hypothetical protein ABI678_08275 [Kofleriaceae bacterium]
MTKLGFALMFVLAVAGCSKSKDPGTGRVAPAGSASTVTGSDMGSPPAGSAMATGSGSAMGSDMGSAMAGSGSAGSAVAMAGSGEGSGSAAWDFDKLTHEEQADFMKKHVVPTMKPLFQKFDAKHYANFGCKTCHGKDPQKAKFKMPSPDLPKLDFAALKAGKQKPKVAEFMGKVVKPEMAHMLNQPEYSEENPKGFGCLECHEAKK